MNFLRNVFLFSLSLLLFAACEEPEATQPVVQPTPDAKTTADIPDVNPSAPTTEQKITSAVEIADLQGTWQLTHIWYPEEGWVSANNTTLDFYDRTFFYSATGWDIEGDSVELFRASPNANRLSFGEKSIQVAGNSLQIGPDFNYTVQLYPQALLVRSDNEEDVYHWFARQ